MVLILDQLILYWFLFFFYCKKTPKPLPYFQYSSSIRNTSCVKHFSHAICVERRQETLFRGDMTQINNNYKNKKKKREYIFTFFLVTLHTTYSQLKKKEANCLNIPTQWLLSSQLLRKLLKQL